MPPNRHVSGSFHVLHEQLVAKEENPFWPSLSQVALSFTISITLLINSSVTKIMHRPQGGLTACLLLGPMLLGKLSVRWEAQCGRQCPGKGAGFRDEARVGMNLSSTAH